MPAAATFNRIEKVLDHIHQNIRQSLTLEGLAEHSCWSRWQLQRVFQDYTGYSVAQYVREIKLSRCAEQLLVTDHRIMDIALEFGFSSEITFSRAFKQFFGCSPKEYRSRGVLTGVKTPLKKPDDQFAQYPEASLYQVRLERGKSFDFVGSPYTVKGLLSAEPDFGISVPRAWDDFFGRLPNEALRQVPHIGLIDGFSQRIQGELRYWAGIDADHIDAVLVGDGIEHKRTLEHDYAVLPYQGPVEQFHKAIIWLMASWLPASGYAGLDDVYEIEIYYPPYDSTRKEVKAEYWLPIISL
ncbi:helix-turn-helix domain-containing protein [Reinekea thalattae]|uniref:Helix-turn-helix domain-containing protein n=1 Tax=Reinekea thalattae TaxID=2593301 RepID=A0A5C8ZB71_9GAMM|nr:helix-turn-helix domain-containing protein [Reinekea thalattae]TXR54403.1 helix-turn-helix domain-containing protein [Reinekea thalattae]